MNKQKTIEWLNQYVHWYEDEVIFHEKNKNCSLTFKKDFVLINGRNVEEIPVQILEVYGDIYANGHKIKNINWLPKKIGGSLNLNSNQIEYFYCQSQIGFSVYLRNNKLKKISIEQVSSNLDISNNPIEEIQIKYVKDSFTFKNTKEYDVQELPVASFYQGCEQIKLMNRKIVDDALLTYADFYALKAIEECYKISQSISNKDLNKKNSKKI